MFLVLHAGILSDEGPAAATLAASVLAAWYHRR